VPRRPSAADDRVTVARLRGAAERQATQLLTGEKPADPDECATIAGNRPDLLAQAAGLLLAAGEAGASSWPERAKLAAQLLIDAGADQAAIPAWVAEGTKRLATRRPLLGDPKDPPPALPETPGGLMAPRT